MNDFSKTEKKLARALFDLAKKRDYEKLKNDINSFQVNTPQDIWELREFLNNKAKEFDKKYDYRYSILEEVFSYFIVEDLLKVEELKELSTSHQEKIISLVKNIKNFNRK